jgi:hypothetical protein
MAYPASETAYSDRASPTSFLGPYIKYRKYVGKAMNPTSKDLKSWAIYRQLARTNPEEVKKIWSATMINTMCLTHGDFLEFLTEEAMSLFCHLHGI